MTVWFTSDLHLGHRLVSQIRCASTPEEHDQALFDKWDSVVRKDDIVWVLGDLAVSSPTRAIAELRGLPGHKHLVAGNHDPCHPMHRDSHKRQAEYFAAFESVQAFARRKIAGAYVMLSHFPYGHDARHLRADGGVDKYAQYRLRDEGMWLLHGHTHLADQRLHDGKQIHVGLDAWHLGLVSLEQVEALMRAGEDAP